MTTDSAVAKVMEALREAARAQAAGELPPPRLVHRPAFLDKVRADPNYPYRETILREAAEKEDGK